MARKSKVDTFSSGAPAGDALVWLSSLGLAVGLFMITMILAVIIWQGLTAFWPREVAEVTVRADSEFTINGAQTFSGEIVHYKTRQDYTKDNKTEVEELQLYVGNRDVYGFSFFYVDVDDIIKIEKPADIMSIEREEYGKAIARPVSLHIKGETSVSADSLEFDDRLRALMDTVAERRDEIHDIEKVEIGRINRKMESIRLSRRRMEREGHTDSEKYRKLVDADAGLQGDYETLAAEAGALRDLQFEHELEVMLLTGEVRRMPLGKLINYRYPNQLRVIDKCVAFAHNMVSFILNDPREANTEGGIFPAIFGTFVMTIFMSLLVTPFGVVSAIYLSEYAKPGLMVRMVRIAVNNLAGVPSIVFGVFGLGFFVYFVGASIDQLFFSDTLPTPTFGTGGMLWASFTLALMTVPVVIVATEEGLLAVPRGMREGGLACGASKWQCIQRIVLPAAAPGILTGMVLAMARGAGEVAPLMLVGVVKLAPTLPLNTTWPYFHFEQKFMHLGFHIYDLGFQSPDSEAAKPMVFATALLLIILVVAMNLVAIYVRERLRRKYAVSAV